MGGREKGYRSRVRENRVTPQERIVELCEEISERIAKIYEQIDAMPPPPPSLDEYLGEEEE